MKKNKISTNHIGQAGEHRVTAELLLRGHNPMVASIDDGIDIILENGRTIQVKTVNTVIYGNRKNSACVSISSVRYKKGVRSHTVSNKSLRINFYIIWVIPWSEFFIIPSGVISPKALNITITPIKSSKTYACKNKWELLTK